MLSRKDRQDSSSCCRCSLRCCSNCCFSDALSCFPGTRLQAIATSHQHTSAHSTSEAHSANCRKRKFHIGGLPCGGNCGNQDRAVRSGSPSKISALDFSFIDGSPLGPMSKFCVYVLLAALSDRLSTTSRSSAVKKNDPATHTSPAGGVTSIARSRASRGRGEDSIAGFRSPGVADAS
jgi:hypothetical protein